MALLSDPFRRFGPAALVIAVLLAAVVMNACSASSSAPLGMVTLTPNAVTVACPSPNTATFVASQANFNGTFTAVSSNTNAATVAPTSPPDTFVVTLGAGGGTSVVTVTGGGGMTGTVNVTANQCVCVRHHDMWQHARAQKKQLK
jgi:hypothetical protein